jgi:hypothetical protein
MESSANLLSMIKVTFTDEERELLEAFAAEQGIEDLSAAIPALVHEIVRLHDQLWDKQLKTLPAALAAKGNAALEAYKAGLTEQFETNSLD